MGMAAGQARLLSITARLTDNELRSQTITNSKLRLAEESSEASQTYMNALNSTQLMFGQYDSEGSLSYQSLTANTLLTFGSLKNQYSLVNSAGQVMLNGSDIKKYMASADLNKFLKSYGVGFVENPKYTAALQDIYGKSTTDDGSYLYESLYPTPGVGLSNSIDAVTGISTNKDGSVSFPQNVMSILTKDVSALTQNDADALVGAVSGWAAGINGLNSEFVNSSTMGGTLGSYLSTLKNVPGVKFPNKDDYKLKTGTNLAESFKLASYQCYQNADNGSSGCYLHVLAHLMLDNGDINSSGAVDASWSKDKTTTTGKAFKVEHGEINNSAIFYGGKSADMEKVSVYLKNHNLAVPEDADDTTTINSPEGQKLISNYKFDSDGNKVLKNWSDRIADLFYAVTNMDSLGLDYNTELLPCLKSFQVDMQETLNSFAEEEYLGAVQNWKNEMVSWVNGVVAQRQTFVDSFDSIPNEEIPDTKDEKYQWYVNLWDRMGAGKNNADGTRDTGNFKELDENLINNPEWLQFALEHGVLTMEQVNFSEDGSDKYSNMGSYDWKSITYTSASDLKSQENETAIAKAEVKYKNAMTEIENKDKKYDQDLKKLDAEHTALQTEYESVKNVIDKNVERSFKAFS